MQVMAPASKRVCHPVKEETASSFGPHRCLNEAPHEGGTLDSAADVDKQTGQTTQAHSDNTLTPVLRTQHWFQTGRRRIGIHR